MFAPTNCIFKLATGTLNILHTEICPTQMMQQQKGSEQCNEQEHLPRVSCAHICKKLLLSLFLCTIIALCWVLVIHTLKWIAIKGYEPLATVPSSASLSGARSHQTDPSAATQSSRRMQQLNPMANLRSSAAAAAAEDDFDRGADLNENAAASPLDDAIDSAAPTAADSHKLPLPAALWATSGAQTHKSNDESSGELAAAAAVAHSNSKRDVSDEVEVGRGGGGCVGGCGGGGGGGAIAHANANAIAASAANKIATEIANEDNDHNNNNSPNQTRPMRTMTLAMTSPSVFGGRANNETQMVFQNEVGVASARTSPKKKVGAELEEHRIASSSLLPSSSSSKSKSPTRELAIDTMDANANAGNESRDISNRKHISNQIEPNSSGNNNNNANELLASQRRLKSDHSNASLSLAATEVLVSDDNDDSKMQLKGNIYNNSDSNSHHSHFAATATTTSTTMNLTASGLSCVECERGAAPKAKTHSMGDAIEPAFRRRRRPQRISRPDDDERNPSTESTSSLAWNGTDKGNNSLVVVEFALPSNEHRSTGNPEASNKRLPSRSRTLRRETSEDFDLVGAATTSTANVDNPMSTGTQRRLESSTSTTTLGSGAMRPRRMTTSSSQSGGSGQRSRAKAAASISPTAPMDTSSTSPNNSAAGAIVAPGDALDEAEAIGGADTESVRDASENDAADDDDDDASDESVVAPGPMLDPSSRRMRRPPHHSTGAGTGTSAAPATPPEPIDGAGSDPSSDANELATGQVRSAGTAPQQPPSAVVYRAPFFTSWYVSIWNVLFMPIFTLISSCCFRGEDSNTKKLLV